MEELRTSNVRLIKGDCLEVMKEIEDKSIDLIITSPPYYNAMDYSHWETYSDYLEFLKNVFVIAFDKIKEGRMCCVNLSVVIEPRKSRNHESVRLPIPFDFVGIMQEIGFKFLEDIIWVKPEGSAKNRNGGFYRHRQPIAYKPNIVNEYIFVFQKPMSGLIDKIVREYRKNDKGESLVSGEYERSNVWYINPETKSNHPAPFPIQIPQNLIKYYSYKNDIVLDMFMGSNTTGLACVKNNRKFIGVEVSSEYYEIGVNRVSGYIKEN